MSFPVRALAQEVWQIAREQVRQEMRGKIIRGTVQSISGHLVTLTSGRQVVRGKGIPMTPGDEVYLANVSENPDRPAYIIIAAEATLTNQGLSNQPIPMVPGFWYSNIERGFGVRDVPPYPTYTMAANRTNFTPIFIPHAQTFDRMAVFVATAVASSKVRVGIFTFNQTSGVMTRVLDGGEIDASGVGLREVTVNVTLQPGVYWLATSGSGSPQVTIMNSPATGWGISTSNLSTYASVWLSLTYGAFPATITPTTNSGSIFPVLLRAA